MGPGRDQDASHPQAQVEGNGALVEKLRDHIRYLRGQLDEERESSVRADTIIAQLAQANAAFARRVPELEAPPEPRGALQAAAEGSGGVEEERPFTQEPQGGAQSSWWRKILR